MMVESLHNSKGWEAVIVVLSFLLFAAGLSAAVVRVPEDVNAVSITFKAGREPTRFDFLWTDGSVRRVVVSPADTNLLINSNSGKRYPTKQAGFEFKGLGIVDFVRPNVTIYRKEIREDHLANWDALPEIYGKEYRLDMGLRRGGAEFHVNGNYAGFVPAENHGRIVQIDSPFTEEDFVLTNRSEDPRYLELDVAPKSNPGAVNDAVVELTDRSIPFIAPTSANLDLGVTASHLSLYPGRYGDSGYTGRNAFDNAKDSYLFTIPMKQYSHAWLLCAVEDDPSKTPSLNARLTRFVPSAKMGGRAYSAIADATCAIPGPNAERVGSVIVDGERLPLWRVELRLDLGKVIDLITHPHGRWGRGAFRFHYLDFELTGETHKRRTPFGDPRPYPDPAKKSSVHVFGVTLEKAPADIVFTQSQPGNVFADDEKPEMKVTVTPVVPGEYTLKWETKDAHGDETGGGEFTTTAAAEKTVDLGQDDLGWYELNFRLFDRSSGRLITEHKAAYALLGPDTREAGFESSYLGWTHGPAHYGEGNAETCAELAMKAGIRRMYGLSNKFFSNKFSKYTERDYAKWKLTDPLVFHGNKVTRTDEEVRKLIADKLEKWPHADQVLVFWEAGRPFSPYAIAPELIGEKAPEYDEARQKFVDARWAFVEQVARVVRKEFPRLKVLLGNSLTCGELVAEVLRRKPPKEWFTHIGTEAINRTTHPEKPNHNFTTMSSRLLIDTAKAFGYDYRVTFCPEGISRKPDTLGEEVCAQWLVRDILVQHAYGFEDIHGVGSGPEAGNIYDASFYGTCALGRTPFMYPQRGYVATATLTRVLDRARFIRFVPTGSDTVYAGEFGRPHGKFVYAIWTSRGEADLSVETSSGDVELVDLYGKSSRPSMWRLRPIWLKPLAVMANTSARYLITDSKVKSISLGGRSYPDDQVLPGFKVVDPVDSLAKWELENKVVDRNYGRLETNGKDNRTGDIGVTHRTLAKANLKEVDDPEKGKCLEITIDSNPKHHKLMNEYAVIKRKEPIPLDEYTHTVGLWVKGNSGWGQIFWELEDANGRHIVSCGSAVADTADYVGRASINFDGWCFLAQPLNAESPIPELSTGGFQHLWGFTPKLPLKLTGIVFSAPAHPLYVTDYKKRKQTVRVKDISFPGTGRR